MRFEELPPTVSFLDFSDYYCDDEVCPPIIGNVHVYLDDNHVIATYMRSMSPMVEQQIDATFAPGGTLVPRDDGTHPSTAGSCRYR